MVEDDIKWIQGLLAEKMLQGPVLELGTGYGGRTAKDPIVASGLRHFGTDMKAGEGVDFVADFERAGDMSVFDGVAPFGSILILNVLEHTFDPIKILDNAISLLKPGGKCVVLTPSVWPLHNFPMDTWRILPNLYEEYARRRKLVLEPRFFDYVGRGPVQSFRDANGNYRFPAPCGNKTRMLWSRIIHKMFNTCGRNMVLPSYVGLGAIFVKDSATGVSQNK